MKHMSIALLLYLTVSAIIFKSEIASSSESKLLCRSISYVGYMSEIQVFETSAVFKIYLEQDILEEHTYILSEISSSVISGNDFFLKIKNNLNNGNYLAELEKPSISRSLPSFLKKLVCNMPLR